jgi:hypothetical protein
MKPSRNGKSKEAVARRLIESHLDVEPTLSRVVRLLAPGDSESDPKEPIKLLEVNSNTPEQGVFPIPLGADPSSEIWFRSVVIEVTPREFEMIRAGSLALPNGWTLGEEFSRRTFRKAAG